MITCTKCGRVLSASEHKRGHITDNAMCIISRKYQCTCGVTSETVELRKTELQELRRKAYLYELGVANDSKNACLDDARTQANVGNRAANANG